MMEPSCPPVTLSLAVPMFNEADGLESFFGRVEAVLQSLDLTYEIVCVDDGSSDDTCRELARRRDQDPRIRVIALSRNFGKEAALAAALEHSRGAAVIPIDADLQDPPEVIARLVEKWREGYPVVIAKRSQRKGDGWLKRQSAHAFYEVFNAMAETPIPRDVGDYRLIDRRVLEAMRLLEERNRFTKGLFAWVGFPTAEVSFERVARDVGSSKWKFRALWRFALDGIFSFSTVPLRIWTYLGLLVSGGAFAYGLFLIIRTLFFFTTTPGYVSLMVVVLFLGGIQLISLGVLGEYVGRIFKETKRRPLYLVDRELD